MSAPLHLILLAGGQSLRAGEPGDPPKQFRLAGGRMLFAISLRTFCQETSDPAWHLASVTVTAPAAWREIVAAELELLQIPRGFPWQIAEPGPTRTASTWQALAALSAAQTPDPKSLVAVHDAARPFASAGLLAAVTRQAMIHGGAIPGVAVPDTIVQSSDGQVRYLQRDQLAAVQTPQVFHWGIFADAHRWARDAGVSFTDDGGLLAARGHSPAVVAGEPGNWKVTTAADWERAEDLLG
jgi:2-C-methyl-D-erythritol 4-phosphate cytidylyltransferase/2-C-methyl-D-erythritol 2,4-cyclodiphosphate synthase